MIIEQIRTLIRDLGEYEDGEHGAWVMIRGILTIIRPEYQREFVYTIEEQVAVIISILRRLTLNTIYFARNSDDTREVMDGQQRLLSILKFINNEFSVQWNGETYYFHNLPADIREAFLDHELLTFLCEGTESEKLEWFKTINKAGIVLNEQEMINGAYHGPFITSARDYFSRPNCRAIRVAQAPGRVLVKGSAIRQDLLATALEWAADAETIARQ